jgi:hypothetical protein
VIDESGQDDRPSLQGRYVRREFEAVQIAEIVDNSTA